MIFENKEVEVFEFEGQVLFNPKDIAQCLDLSDSALRTAMTQLNSKQVRLLKNSHVQNLDFRKLNNRGENFLTEAGIYKFLFRSRRKEAEKFQEWVTDEVLPQIRKTGGYITTTENMTDEDIMTKAILLANTKIQERDKRNKELEPVNM